MHIVFNSATQHCTSTYTAHLKLFVDTRHYNVILSLLQGKQRRRRGRRRRERISLDTRHVLNKQLTMVSPVHIHWKIAFRINGLKLYEHILVLYHTAPSPIVEKILCAIGSSPGSMLKHLDLAHDYL